MSFFKKLWESIKHLFQGLEPQAKHWVKVAVEKVQVLKEIMESSVPDVVAALIHGEKDDKVISVIKEWVPKLLLEMHATEEILAEKDSNKQMQMVLDRLKLSSDEKKKIVYHGLASLIIEKMSDGKFDWKDAIAVSQYYYSNILGTPEEAHV